MNRFGFLAENIRPLGSGDSNLFSDSMMTRDEKKAMFGAKPKTVMSLAQKAHQANVKKVATLRKKGYTMAEAWKIVKSGKSVVPKKKTTSKTKTKSETKPKAGKTLVKRKPSTKAKAKSTNDLTPAQKRAKRAMKLAHTKYKGKPDALKKAWKEIKKAN